MNRKILFLLSFIQLLYMFKTFNVVLSANVGTSTRKSCYFEYPSNNPTTISSTPKPTTTSKPTTTIIKLPITSGLNESTPMLQQQSGTFNFSQDLILQMMTLFNPKNLSQTQMSVLKSLLVGSCWRDSYTRGAGEGITECDENTEDKDGALCYPKCAPGYTGVGPVCWEKCKEEYSDRGVFCIIDLYIYSKGCCCVSNNSCCNICPANFTDDGCTCRRPPKSYPKKSYGRGAGTPLTCKPNYELNGALCYPVCKEGYSGAGPVCWKNCIEPLINDCGGLCTLSESTCAFKTFNLVYLLGVPFKTMTAWVAGLGALVNLQSLYDIPVEYSVPKCF